MRALLIVLLTLSAACPRKAVFDPTSTGHMPRGGHPQARERFDRARALFESNDWAGAREELEAVQRDYPDDPIAPHVALYSGMAALRKGDPAAAVAELEPLVEAEDAGEDVRKRARFFLGLGYAAVGKPGAARDLLEPFDGQLGEGEERVELDASLATAYDGLGDSGKALPRYDRLYLAGSAAEKAHAAARSAALVDALPDAALEGAWQAADKRAPAALFIARRLTPKMCASNQTERAQRFVDETAGIGAALGLSAIGCGARGGERSDRLGALLPMSGKRRLVGEAALRGLYVAAGAFDVESQGFTLVSRDAKDGVAAVPGALDELAGEGVIAVVGPADKDAARAAGERAAALGLPVISLDVGDEDPTASPLVFRVVVPVEQRARALARAAYAQGARDFAVLAPSMTYGARATAAFADEVGKLGGKVIVTVNYAKDATSFVDPVKKIAGVPFDALFVPDTASRLELVAPQLAVANLVVQPLGARKPRRGRGIALLSTAEALTPAFLRGSARYADGALLAPGFYADDAHPRVGPYVRRFRAAFGSDPTYLDAYAFDAALAVGTVVAAGASTRGQVAEGLGRATVAGVTGDVRFDAGHGRADTGFVYQVVSEATGPAIRVLGVRVPVK